MASEAGQQFELPKHVAIIMDGNRRWAKAKGLPVDAGHKAGFETFDKIVEYAFRLGVDHVTVYAFSTENWKRTPLEVNAIMALATQVADFAFKRYRGKNIKVQILGRKEDLPAKLQKKIAEVETETKDCTGKYLNVAFSYGGRAEIVDSVKAVIANGEEITEDNVSKNLYTAGQPDPELIIRTGGTPRLSNFLMWQSAYSEIYFTETLWPDFGEESFDDAIRFYNEINRNFGR